MTDIPWQGWAALVGVLLVFGLSLLWASRYTDERWWLRRQQRGRYTYRVRGRKR